MNTPTEEELEAEIDRQRQIMRERSKHSKSFAPVAAALIFVSLAYWGTLNFVILYGLSEWRKIATIAAVIAVLVVAELVALRINSKKGRPVSPYTIFIALLLAIAAVLALFVNN